MSTLSESSLRSVVDTPISLPDPMLIPASSATSTQPVFIPPSQCPDCASENPWRIDGPLILPQPSSSVDPKALMASVDHGYSINPGEQQQQPVESSPDGDSVPSFADRLCCVFCGSWVSTQPFGPELIAYYERCVHTWWTNESGEIGTIPWASCQLCGLSVRDPNGESGPYTGHEHFDDLEDWVEEDH